jgi:putative flippase GtrA
LAGGWNTAFGYGIMIFLFENLSNSLNIVEIGIMANILSITMSFLTYKIYVFQKMGNWINEYLRCYLVYGSLAILNIVMNWVLVDYFHISIWISQGICIPAAVLLSYFGHSKFTFKNKNHLK